MDQSEALVLDRILSRVVTHAPPQGADIEAVYAGWPNQAGRDYIDAVYRPKPIGSLLSDDLIVRRPWFLITLPHAVNADDAAALVRQAAGKLAEFEIYDRKDFFGMSARRPTRLARFVREQLAPQLDEAALVCTAELLLARAAVQEAKRGQGVWPPAFIQHDQRHSVEVELVLLAEASGTFGWYRDEGERLVFRSAQIAKISEELAAAETQIRQLQGEVQRLGEIVAEANDSELVGRFKRLYRKHILRYHPDKLIGRPEQDQQVGEEVTRVLNALYQDIKI